VANANLIDGEILGYGERAEGYEFGLLIFYSFLILTVELKTSHYSN
jgi:hypothetical protein